MASSIPNTRATDDRTTLRTRLAELQGKLRATLADKKSRVNDIVALCRSERRATREQLQERRKHALEQVEHEIAAARASARALRLSRLAEVRRSADSEIAAARAAIAVERAHRDELRRIVHDERRRRAEVHRLHEIAARSGELHTALLGPFASLLQRIGTKVKPVPGESRAEALLRYAQTHPDEAHAAAEPEVERAIEQTRQEIRRTKEALRKTTRDAAGRRSNAPPKRGSFKGNRGVARLGPPERSAKGVPAATPAKPAGAGKKVPEAARRPGQVPRGAGPGLPLEVLLRERDLLARKGNASSVREPSSTKTAPVARPGKGGKRASKKRKGGEPPPPPQGTPPEALSPASSTVRPANDVVARRTEATVKARDVHNTAILAKLIRQDIQAAVAAGKLPAAKYSVTTEKYSMGSNINVLASKLPFPVLNDAAFYPTKFGPQFDSDHFRSRMTPDAERLQQDLEAIVGAYHWDRSDSMTDYYNERFHKDIRLDDRGEMDRIREKFARAAKDPTRQTEPFVWQEPAGGLLDAGWYASDDGRGRRGPFSSKAEAERS